MKVHRINASLAIVPSAVAHVQVHAVRMTPTREHVEFYSVGVRYWFSDEELIVASFHPGPAATWEMVGGKHDWVPVPGFNIEAELAGCEARAHAVYESIIRAVREAVT